MPFPNPKETVHWRFFTSIDIETVHTCYDDWCCPCTGIPLVGNLRTRLLALHVLEAVLPACESSVEDDQMAQVWYLDSGLFENTITFQILNT